MLTLERQGTVPRLVLGFVCWPCWAFCLGKVLTGTAAAVAATANKTAIFCSASAAALGFVGCKARPDRHNTARSPSVAVRCGREAVVHTETAMAVSAVC